MKVSDLHTILIPVDIITSTDLMDHMIEVKNRVSLFSGNTSMLKNT